MENPPPSIGRREKTGFDSPWIAKGVTAVHINSKRLRLGSLTLQLHAHSTDETKRNAMEMMDAFL